MNRTIFLAIVVTVIAAGSAVMDHRSGGVEPPDVSTSTPPGTISAPGIVEGATEAIDLVPEVTGVVTERLVEVGDQVKAGQILLRLDDREARLRVAAAVAELASVAAKRERLINGARPQERAEARALREAAAARLQQAETALNRTTRLESQRAITEQEADDARSKVDALKAELTAAIARVDLLEAPARADEIRLADARIAAAQAALDTARVALEKTLLRAPTDAQILDMNVEAGELIFQANTTPVITLADTRQLRVRAYVEEFDAPRVRVGAPVTITADGLAEAEFQGRVAVISPRMSAVRVSTDRPAELYDAKTREVLVDLTSECDLIIGLRVDISTNAVSE